MAGQDVLTNVVLTADNSQYDQAMMASAGSTDNLGKSVDSLGTKIDKLTKSAGRKLIGVSAADTAVLATTTLAYGAFEKQMTALNARAAILNTTMATQNKAMDDYATSVNSLRENFGMATSEAAELTMTITRLSGLPTSGVDQLAKTFGQMGQATQESASGLANSVLQLQKTMGSTPGKETERYANQLTVLSQATSTSATGLAEFAQQIAPVARQVGTTQTEVHGLAAAFAKAGQDGFQAQNFYIRMMNDISYAAQSGSPRLNEFADLAGVLPEKFKNMSGLEQFNSIIESLNQQGPRAVNTLNMLGYEGNRMSKVALSLSQQGGIMGMVGQARAADQDPGAMGRGAERAMDGMFDSMTKLRIAVTQMGEAFGKFWAGPAGKFFDLLAGGARALRDLAASPLGQLAAAVMGLAAPFIAFAGAILMAAKAITAFALARQLLTGSLSAGFRETAQLTPSARAAMAAQGMIPGVGAGRMSLGPQGANIGQDPTWARRMTYNVGSDIARFTGYQSGQAGSALRTAGGLGAFGAGKLLQYGVAPQFAAASQGIPMGVTRNADGSFAPQYMPGTGGYNDVTRRSPIFTSPTFRGSFGFGPEGPMTRAGQSLKAGWQGAAAAAGPSAGMASTAMMAAAMASGGTADMSFRERLQAAYRGSRDAMRAPSIPAGGGVTGSGIIVPPPGEIKIPTEEEAGKKGYTVTDKRAVTEANKGIKESTTSNEKNSKAAADAAKSTERFSKTMAASERGVGTLGKAVAQTAVAMGTAGAGMARFGAGLGAQAMGMVGGNYLLAGGLAAYGGYKAYQAATADTQLSKRTDQTNFALPYLEAAGLSELPVAPGVLTAQAEAASQSAEVTLKDAYRITATEQATAKADSYKLTNEALKGKKAGEIEAMLGAQFGYGAKTPEFVEGVAADLTNILGRTDAEAMLGRLRAGERKDPFFLAEQAAAPGRSGFMDTITNVQSGELAMKKLDPLFAVIDDTASFIADTKGLMESQQYQLDAYNKSIESFNTGIEKAGFWNQKTVETEQVFFGSLLQELGATGIEELTGKQAIGFRGDETIEEVLKTAIVGKTVEGERFGAVVKGENLKKMLGEAGVADTSMTGQEAYDALLVAQTGMDSAALEERNNAFTKMEAQTRSTFGAGGLLNMPAVQEALVTNIGSENAQYQAMQSVIQQMRSKGMGPVQQVGTVLRGMRTAGGVAGLGGELLPAVLGQIQQSMALRAPYMSRTESFAQQSNLFSTVQGAPLAGPQGEKIKQENALAYAQSVQDQYNWAKNLLYQQREYNVMRERAEESFNMQREYAQDDFATQRERQEAAYQLSRKRAIRDFNIAEKQAVADFNLSRRRAAQDHHHQEMLMIEQQAQAYTNIYERVAVQRTTSGAYIVANVKDQTERLREQTENLEKAREMGLSNVAIRAGGLNTPEKAQELARLVAEGVRNPRVIRQMNAAIQANVKAAGGLATDESNRDWTEFQRQYHRMMRQGAEDFDRNMRRSRNAFNRGLQDQQDDYQLMMDHQQEDYKKMMHRQVVAYNIQMEQAAEDLVRSAKTIDGSFEEILTKATKRLSGHAAKQAKAVLDEFKGTKGDIRGVSTETMIMMSDIFGFNWTPPASVATTSSADDRRTSLTGGTSNSSADDRRSNVGYAAGGVVPGWTPGRDEKMVPVSGGEAVMRPEWTRAVGKEYIDAANHKAAHGGFAKGGVVNPDGRVYMDTEPVSRITKAQLLLAEKLGKMNMTVMQGSWQPYSDYSGSSHMGPGVVDTSPGNFSAQYWLRRVGFAAWGRNFPGAASAGSGAHVHSVSRVDPGAAGHVQLSSFARGEDGLGGRDYGPDPGVLPNLMELLGQFSNLQLSAGGKTGGGGGVGIPSIGSLLKDEYPSIENKVARWVGVHLPRGTISGIINRLARRRYAQMRRRHPGIVAAMSAGGFGGSLGGLPTGADYGADAQGVWNALTAVGFNKIQTAGIMGNMQSESGFDPFIVQGGGHSMNPGQISSGYGLVQWTPGSKLVPYLHGHPPSVATEVNALAEQLAGKGPSAEGAAGVALRNAHTIRQATRAFELQYERHAGPPQDIRVTQAQAIHRRFAADGAIVDGARGMVVGESGPEAVLPLDRKGSEFLADTMRRYTGDSRGLGLGSTPMGGGVTVMNYRIDKSTTFSGPITVQANDPNELIAKLQARNRLQALTRPGLAGSGL